MEDPKTIRLNDADTPDRRARFETRIKRSANNGNEVVRQLVDAWLAYCEEHGHPPNFPVRIVPVDPKEPKPKRKP
jgi:hypothetical protein